MKKYRLDVTKLIQETDDLLIETLRLSSNSKPSEEGWKRLMIAHIALVLHRNHHLLVALCFINTITTASLIAFLIWRAAQ